MLSPGDKVKDYEVVAPIGSGGMAMLYLARRRGVGGFSRLVTLKLVHPHLIEDEHVVALFLKEARISAHVTHPNVVHVEDVGRAAGSYFIAMEYVHGVTLAELLARLNERRLRLRPTLCAWLAAQIAEALHAAHEARTASGVPLDIVHRDVSPQNVLIGHTGHVKLIDFGIAKSQAESDRRSGGRSVLGKLHYMSPEQLELKQADRRTDVYALGVMLWEMLAGRRLLRCQRFDDERDWATRENPPEPSRYATYSLHRLDRVVLKALACDPSKRYASAFQFRTALLRAVPATVQLDAPMVAAVMRSMFGDELDRRRASWPSEVVGALDVAANAHASRQWRLDQLTADNAPAAALCVEDELLAGSPEDTAGATAEAANQTSEPDAPGSEGHVSAEHAFPAEDSAPQPAALPIASAIDTLKVPPLVDGGRSRLGQRSFRVATIGAVCLVTGILLGSHFSQPPTADMARALEPERTGAAHGARTGSRASTPEHLEEDEIARECEARARRAHQSGRSEHALPERDKHRPQKRASARRAERTAKPTTPGEKRKRVATHKPNPRLTRPTPLR